MEEALAEIRTVAAQLSAVDDDVLDVLLANAIANGADVNGLHTIEIDAILETRQRGVRHKTEGAKTYLAGRRQETRDDVVERLTHRLALPRILRSIETYYVSSRRKTVREYDRVSCAFCDDELLQPRLRKPWDVLAHCRIRRVSLKRSTTALQGVAPRRSRLHCRFRHLGGAHNRRADGECSCVRRATGASRGCN